MSRALEKGVEEALKDGTDGAAFERISAVLSQTSDSLLEIELLGQSHVVDADTYFLQDGNAIAIPKPRLVQAFIHARQILTGHLQGRLKCAEQQLGSATAVMLLMDPEHLTAANTRKRIVAGGLSRPGDATGLLLQEKRFTDSLLTGRLHRHTKSPIVWSHRRWLMERFAEAGLAIDVAEDLRKVVLVSAERHPRNYYAWCHARYLMDSVGNSPAGVDVGSIVADSKRWCFSHHDDVSGWMFLLFLLGRWPKEAVPALSETLTLAESLHWRNESVWYFVRNVMAGGHVAGAPEDQFRSVWQALRRGTRDGSEERDVLDEASSWVKTYSARPWAT